MAQPPAAAQQQPASPPQLPSLTPAPSQDPNLPPPDPVMPSAAKPRSLSRPWQPPQPCMGAAPPSQRGGGVAIGIPAHHTGPPPVPSDSSSAPSQARPALIGTLGSSSQPRTSVMSSPQRPIQSPSFRIPASSIAQPPSSQGHSLLRGPSMSSPASSSPSTSQPMPSPNKPWLSSTSQGKLPLSSPSFMQQLNPPSMQQRSHISQQIHHPPSSTASRPTHHIKRSISLGDAVNNRNAPGQMMGTARSGSVKTPAKFEELK